MVSVIDLRAAVRNDPDGALVLHLEGEVDVESSPLINRVVDAALIEGEPRVVVDLAGVTFLDSRGIRALLSAHESAESRGAELVVRSPRKQALDVLLMSGCEHILNLV